MVPVSGNFGKKDPCLRCQIDQDSQEHLIDCIIIKGANRNVLYNHLNVQKNDIYSDNIVKMRNAAFLFKEALRSTEIILEYQTERKKYSSTNS